MTVLAVSLKLPVKETSPPSKTVTGVEGAPRAPRTRKATTAF